MNYADDQVTCYACEAEIEPGCECIPENRPYRGFALCEPCYDKNYFSCDNCHEEAPICVLRTSDDGDNYCEYCYVETYTSCHVCGVEMLCGDACSTEYGSDDYCRDCYRAYFTHCHDCDNEISVDDAMLGLDGNDYCRRCHSPTPDYDENNPPSWMTFDEIGSRRMYSIELETAKCDDEDVGGFKAKDDGSITGKEYVFSCQAGDDSFVEIDKFCEEAGRRGYSVDSRCGYHVHLDVSRLTVEQLKSIATAYFLTEKVWLRFAPRGRVEGVYTRPLRWAPVDFSGMGMTTFRRFCAEQDRYQFFNVAAFAKHSTFEIRLHTGTLNPVKIKNWIRSHAWFFDGVKDLSEEELYARFFVPLGECFAAIAAIWDHPPLAAFYQARAAKFGQPIPAAEATEAVEATNI